MVRPHILILDCTTLDEPSEGRLLSEFLEVCQLWKPAKARPHYVHVRSRPHFLKELSKADGRYDIIHISAHGSKEKPRSATLGDGKNWEVSSEEIEKIRPRTKLVFMNACECEYQKMADAFDSKRFLAPKTRVDRDDAAVFMIMFYKKYLVDDAEFETAFESARASTKTAKDYRQYWYYPVKAPMRA